MKALTARSARSVRCEHADSSETGPVAQQVVDDVLEAARWYGSARNRKPTAEVDAIAIRTEMAEEWFTRLGFEPVDPSSTPSVLAASLEFQGLCPDSYTTMMRGPVAGARSSG